MRNMMALASGVCARVVHPVRNEGLTAWHEAGVSVSAMQLILRDVGVWKAACESAGAVSSASHQRLVCLFVS